MIDHKSVATGADRAVRLRSPDGAEKTRPLAGPSAPQSAALIKQRSAREISHVLVCAHIHRIHASSTSDALRETAAQLRELHRAMCEIVLAHDGCVLELGEDSLIAAFGPGLAAQVEPALLAARAAIQLQIELSRVRAVGAVQARNGLNALAITIGIHSIGVPAAIGAGADDAARALANEVSTRLCDWSDARAWSIVVEQSVRDRIAAVIAMGRTEVSFLSPNMGPIRVFEVLGFAPDAKAQSNTRAIHSALLKALVENGSLLTRAAGLRRPPTRAPASAEFSPTNREPMPKIDDYSVVRRIGQGGMSTVYLGLHIKSGVPHALKVLDITKADNEILVQRFIEEHALIAQLRHPNVVQIFGQGFTAAHAYIAMEYMSAGDLRELIAAGVRPSKALRILAQITAGLAAIHAAGILHMDLKPDNIMLREDGTLAIADFGIAQTKAKAARGPQHGESFGTPQYVSPEQAQGRPADSRSDLYSLGVLLFEMLAGRKPFSSEPFQQSADESGQDGPPQLPAPLSALQPLIDVLLAYSPADRLVSARELLDFVPVFLPAAAAADQNYKPAVEVDSRAVHGRTVPLPTTATRSVPDAGAGKKSGPITPQTGAGRIQS